MNLADLTAAVTEHFRADADRYRLEPEKIEARYVLNLGGFVNANFTVTDGERAYHVKLSVGPYEIGRLWRWFQLRAALEVRHHAPPVVGWVALAGTHAEGMVFTHIDGTEPDLTGDETFARTLVGALDHLHGDTELAASLGNPRPARASFQDVFVERLTSDLEEIAHAGIPPFVDDATWDWMLQATDALIADADVPEFDEVCASPIHGDANPLNVLVRPSGEWFLTDWDDLAIGDPALDLAIAMWPRVRAGLDAPLGARDEAFTERFALYARANLLDEVVDSLSDWVQAGAAPDHAERVRALKQRVHTEALEMYRGTYA